MTTEQHQVRPTPHSANAQCRCPACAASIPTLIERENLRQTYNVREVSLVQRDVAALEVTKPWTMVGSQDAIRNWSVGSSSPQH